MRLINGRTALLLAPCAFAFLVVSSLPVPARAHVVEAGADLRVTQTFAVGEVTIVVAGVSRVPAPLRVSAQAMRPEGLVLDVELRSLADGSRSTGAIRVGWDPAALRVGHAGAYELRVRAGDEVSVIPFRVLVPRSASWVRVMDGAVLVAGLLIVGGILTRRTSPMVVGGASAAAAVAVTMMLLASHLPAARPDGVAPPAEQGRPYAQGRFTTVPARPVTGIEFTLTLRLTDGATGWPVEDLAVHHEAPAHLVVTSADGAVFRHVHPLRTAPGVLAVRLGVPRPGRYFAYAEIERQDSGGQLVSGTFEVSGSAEPDLSPDAPAVHSLTPTTPSAGSPMTVEITAVGPIQTWLGMPGHLIVRSEDGGYLAHAHGTAAYGSVLSFTLTIWEPGRYLAWVQYATAGRLMTRSFAVEVVR
nr:hypothetical protein [Micromonospora sp. DSM 115978]